MTLWPIINKFGACTTLVALSVLISVPAYAQVTGATVTGTVTDQSGALTPGVKIMITNMATGITANTVANGAGFYTAPNLTPGRYRLTAAAQGFKTVIRSGLILTTGENLVLNLTMQVGRVTQTVTVTGQAPTVNLANSTLGGLKNAASVEQLPLNGRSWTDLAALQAGVNFVNDQAPIGSGDRVLRGFGVELTVSGGRPQQNNYLLDGINIDDYANAGPGNVLGDNLGVGAVQEFTVLTANIGAQYGRTSGGVISAVTKSGTNQFHGSAYEFVRNSALDAANFFDNASNSPIAPFRRNQYGASAGGPIQKDKTFIFGDYEGVKQALGTTLTNTVPTATARAGNLSTGPVIVDPAVAKFINAFIPLPNEPVPPGSDAGNFSILNMQDTTENFFIIRTDHTFSEKDLIHGTYMFDKASQSVGDEYNNKLIHNPVFRQMVGLEWNHTASPQLLNSFRVGFNRDNVNAPANATAVNPLAASTAFAFEPGAEGPGVIDPLPELSAGFSGGLSTQAPLEFHWNSWQAYDNVFYTRGNHFMTFGANIERIQSNTLGTDFPGGDFHFNTLADFLTNTPASLVADPITGITPRGVRQTIFGVYFQDDFHFRPNLTLNLGLRYEPSSVISEVQGKLSNLRVLNSLKPSPFTGSPYELNPTKRNFEPRVGFAWDPFKSGKTAVRGGFGVFDMLPLPLEMGAGIDGSFPFNSSLVGASLPQGSFPLGAYSFLAGQSEHRYYITEFAPKRNYIMQWNFNIQRQIAPNTSVMVGYVGAHGLHSRVQSDDVNIVLPTQTPQGYEWPCPSFTPTLTPQGTTIQLCNQPGTGTNINQFMARTQMSTFNGVYSYNGLEVQINKMMSHGLQVEGTYTWSKNIDNGSGAIASDQYRNSIDNLLWFCRQTCARGLSDTNIANVLTANYVWDIPTPVSFRGPAKALLGGWETGGILTVESGSPFTAQVTPDPLGLNSTATHQYPDRLVGLGCTSDVNPGNPNQYIKLQCFLPPNPSTRLGNGGRNTLIGPGRVTMDFSLSRNIPIKRISEAFNVQIRADAFNIFNRANFDSPWQNWIIMNSDGSLVPFGGQIVDTNTPSRQMQLSMQLTW